MEWKNTLNSVPNNNNNTIWGGSVFTGEEPPPHTGELNHALSQAGAPTQSQLSRPTSSGHHISTERRQRRKQLNSDTNARKQKIKKNIFLKKKGKKRRNKIREKEEEKEKRGKKGRKRKGKEPSKGYPPEMGRKIEFFSKNCQEKIVTKLRHPKKNHILSTQQRKRK